MGVCLTISFPQPRVRSAAVRTSPAPGRGRRGAGPVRRSGSSRRSRRPGVGGPATVEAAGEQVVDRPRRGRRPRGRSSRAARSKTLGSSAGRRLRSPPKSSGALAGPLGRGAGGPQHVLGRQLRPVVGRVQVGDADAGGGAGEAPSRAAPACPRGSPARAARRSRRAGSGDADQVRFEPPSPEAIRSGFRRASSAAQRRRASCAR